MNAQPVVISPVVVELPLATVAKTLALPPYLVQRLSHRLSALPPRQGKPTHLTTAELTQLQACVHYLAEGGTVATFNTTGQPQALQPLAYPALAIGAVARKKQHPIQTLYQLMQAGKAQFSQAIAATKQPAVCPAPKLNRVFSTAQPTVWFQQRGAVIKPLVTAH
jgi:hypothetical protein